MENLTLPQTQYTPEIHLNLSGNFAFTGKSYPENTFEFYTPILEWIRNYFQESPASTTTLNMEIIYFNSSSSKLFFDLFDILDENQEKCRIEVNWIYDAENEIAKEAGEDFIADFENLTINLVCK